MNWRKANVLVLQDTLFGARLLDLPPPKQVIVWLRFNETERSIYEIVKNRFIQRINSISKQENGAVNHYNHICKPISDLL